MISVANDIRSKRLAKPGYSRNFHALALFTWLPAQVFIVTG